ncbi:MAG: tripartite tricarboxylate transporter substrate-binding protein [Verrucomicrobiota bacterium]
MTRLWHGIAIPLIVALLIWRLLAWSDSGAESVFPAKPIHVVVPYTAGGGTDSFVRLITKTVAERDLLPEPFVVINQPGGSGTIGSRYVKDARPDGYRILCHHESIITAKLSGSVPFGPEAFVPIVQTGGIPLLVVVREDAPWQTIRELLEATKEAPKTLRFGANLGSPAHFTAMKLEAAYPGAEFNLITTGGGQKRVISLLGGHLEAGIFALSEYLAFRAEEGTLPDQNIRALAVLSPERLPALPEVGTCREEGIEVTSDNAYYWWAPLGTPETVIDTLSGAILRAWEDEELRDTLNEWAISSEVTQGEALSQRIADRVSAMESYAIRANTDLPDFPRYAIALVILLGAVVIVQSVRKTSSPKVASGETKNRSAIVVFLIVCGAVFILQLGLIPFVFVTIPMVFLCGLAIAGKQRRHWPVLAEIALLVGLGSEFVFTCIFTVALP